MKADPMDAYERAVSRRDLLRLGMAAGVAAVWLPRGLLWGWDADPLPVTPNVTIGPFYPILKPMDRDMDLTRVKGKRGRAQGQVMHRSTPTSRATRYSGPIVKGGFVS
jgi:hypothetical protein